MFEEKYIIRFNYRKEDGFVVIGEEKEIALRIKHGDNEKDNHDLATSIFLENCNLNEVKVTHSIYQ